MATPTKRQKRGQIRLGPTFRDCDVAGFPLEPDEWLDNGLPDPAPSPIITTGFNDEEDARAHLAIRFNSMFCPNCQNYWNKEDVHVIENKDLDKKWFLCPAPECDIHSVQLQEFGDERPYRFRK